MNQNIDPTSFAKSAVESGLAPAMIPGETDQSYLVRYGAFVIAYTISLIQQIEAQNTEAEDGTDEAAQEPLPAAPQEDVNAADDGE